MATVDWREFACLLYVQHVGFKRFHQAACQIYDQPYRLHCALCCRHVDDLPDFGYYYENHQYKIFEIHIGKVLAEHPPLSARNTVYHPKEKEDIPTCTIRLYLFA